MSKHRCIICGYIYDEEAGDPGAGIEPGTDFDQLPADWLCPVCGAGVNEFIELE
jgi:rubredoxin